MQLTVHDVAKLLRVSEKTVYRWLRQGTIPAYRVSDQYRFNRSELAEWVSSRRVSAAPAIQGEPETDTLVMPTLEEAFQAGGIYYRVAGSDKASALRAVVSVMRPPEGLDSEQLREMVEARESLASTGIGDGIAIPHARYPLGLNTTRAMVSLCYLDTPVDWGAMDGKPVSLVFLQVCPNMRAHLHLLSLLSFAVRDPAVREALDGQGSREEILHAIHEFEESLSGAVAA